MPPLPDTATVIAARDGDLDARDRLVAGCLPLVYNIVGRALGGHTDVDDVVQETMLRVLRGLSGLREPASLRSWLVAITMRQVRDRHRTAPADPVATEVAETWHDPGSDFADLSVARLELSGQRREVAQATRWLQPADRELLSLWWLETAGELTRSDVVAAAGGSHAHVAVAVQRMKARLDAARAVVRALDATPGCPHLLLLTAEWDGRPAGLWRKRLARHTRECPRCSAAWSGLVPAESLLVGLSMVPIPPSLLVELATSGLVGRETTGWVEGPTSSSGAPMPADVPAPADLGAGSAATGAATPSGLGVLAAKPLVAVVATIAVVGAGAAAIGAAASSDPDGREVPLASTAWSPAPASVPAMPEASAPVTATMAPAPPSIAPTQSTAPTPTAAEASAGPVATAPPPARPAETSPKKGVATWEFDDAAEALVDVGAGWFYNWSATDANVPAPPGVEFVPMIWGEDFVDERTLATAAGKGEVLLGFNEPDLAEQADMSVERALELWPRLEATGMRLGSPAVAWGAADDGGWLDRFMTGAQSRGLRVDFITLHWYGSDFSASAVDHLRSYLDATYRRYGLPIWVTEYGLIDFAGSPRYPNDDELVRFVRGSTAMMESLPYVERYAWFGLPADGHGIGLYRNGPTPTPAGMAYREAGSG